jgi:hypothetical protein
MNSVFIHQAKHHGFLSPIEATDGDMLDHCLGKLYFNGSTKIPEADRETNIRAPPVKPYQLIVVCCDVCFCWVKAS